MNKQLKHILGLLALGLSLTAYAETLTVDGDLEVTGQAGIGTSTPDASAILDMTSTDKGLLAPRMTTAQRMAITSPATGLLIFNTDNDLFYYYDGIAWVSLQDGVGTDNQGLSLSGTTLNIDNGASADLSILEGDITLNRVSGDGINRKLTLVGSRNQAGANKIFGQIDFKNYDSDSGQMEYIGASIRSENLDGLNSGDLRFYTNDNGVPGVVAVDPELRMIIADDGDIGIGTNDPGAKLDVDGNANFTGDVTATNVNATNLTATGLGGSGTQMVVADNSGVLSTQAIPAGADNLGNHAATTDLNMGGNDIIGVTGFDITGATNITNTNIATLGDVSYSPQAGNESIFQNDTNSVANDKGFTETPWLYTNAIEALDERGTNSTAITVGNDGKFGADDQIHFVTKGESQMNIDIDGKVQVNDLSGTGDRMVIANASGDLSTQAIPVNNDNDSSNELNTTFTLNGTDLELTDAGGTLTANLSSLVDDDDWSFYSGSGDSGNIYHSGDISVGTTGSASAFISASSLELDDVEYPLFSVRGANGAAIAGFNGTSSGLLGVFDSSMPNLDLPLVQSAGVLGYGSSLSNNSRAGVYGYMVTTTATAYAGIFQAIGVNTQENYGIHVTAANGSNNFVGYFVGEKSYFSGRIGLGTQTPTEKLDVVGNANFTGDVTATNVNATNLTATGLGGSGTRMVVADSSGVLSTQTIPTSGDNDSSNEIQTLSLSGTTLSLSNGGGSVALPAGADNLGNHTATQDLNMDNTYDIINVGDILSVNQMTFAGSSGSIDMNNGDIFDVDDILGADQISGVNRVSIGTTSTQYTLTVSGTAGKSGGGSWSVFSDQRMKKDISDFSDGLDIIDQINPVTFKYNGKAGHPDDGKEYVGVIAQEVKTYAPYMVETVSTKLNKDDAENTDLFVYNDSALNYILVNAVQEQQAMIREQQKTIDDQKAAIEALQQEQANTRLQLEAVMAHLEQMGQSGLVASHEVQNAK